MKKWSKNRKIGFWAGFAIGVLYGLCSGESGDPVWNFFSGAGTGTVMGLLLSWIVGKFESKSQG